MKEQYIQPNIEIFPIGDVSLLTNSLSEGEVDNPSEAEAKENFFYEETIGKGVFWDDGSVEPTADDEEQ